MRTHKTTIGLQSRSGYHSSIPLSIAQQANHTRRHISRMEVCIAAATAPESFEQAIAKFEEAVKAGLKMQEEASSAWSEILSGAGTPQDRQTRFDDVVKESIPKAQENFDTMPKSIESKYTSSLDLLKKAMEAAQATSFDESKNRTEVLWERSIQAMRENTQTMVQANAKISEAWTDLMTKPNGKPKSEA